MRRFVLVLFVFASCAHAQPLSGDLAKMSDTSADFRRAMETVHGKPLVVNFWATWCDPCKAETPRLVAAAKRYKGRVDFVGIDVQDSPTLAARFVRHAGVKYTIVPDPTRALARSQGLLGLPVTQFYDAKGRQVSVHRGELKADVLASELSKLVKS